jgi:hypothetical protein
MYFKGRLQVKLCISVAVHSAFFFAIGNIPSVLRLYVMGRFSARNPHQNGGITMVKYKVALLLALISALAVFVTGKQRPAPVPVPNPSPTVIRICRPIPICPNGQGLDVQACKCVPFPPTQ